MNVFELASEREQQMEKLYRDLANNAKHQGIKKIMTMMADEEAKHTRIFAGMEKKLPEETKEHLIADAKVILRGIKQTKDTMNVFSDQVELYKKVRDSEKESEELYRQEAQKAKHPDLKKTFLAFAEEELRHYELMDEIVQFVERPEVWVEDAEFSNLDRY